MQNSLLYVHAIFRLVEHDRRWTIENFVGDFHAAVRRKTVHEDRVWRGLLLPEADLSLQGRALAPGFEGWVRQQLLADIPYDKMSAS